MARFKAVGAWLACERFLENVPENVRGMLRKARH